MGVPKSWLLSQVSKPHMQGFLALCTARCTLQVHIYIHFDQYEKCAQKMFTVYYISVEVYFCCGCCFCRTKFSSLLVRMKKFKSQMMEQQF